MCRIAGFWEFSEQYDRDSILSAMRDSMSNGGPDDAGNILIENGPAFGHRRLSILDLSERGHQPMWDSSESVCITYNGEIYNFQILRDELISHGYSFTSGTDTEVLANAWHFWGKSCVSRLRGMFAFAVWDSRERKLYLVRDRMGIKPLYWYYDSERLIFCSEAKAFKQHHLFRKGIDRYALSSYLTWGYIPDPLCIYENASKLCPGEILIIGDDQEISTERYWSPESDRYSCNDTEIRDKIAEVEELIKESVRIRMMADVPVGLYLSGGIDSSLLASVLYAQGIKPSTFSIGFECPEFNEADHAKRIASYLGTDHHSLVISNSEMERSVHEVLSCFSEPFSDSSCVPTFILARFTRSHVKVALSGDGGDEVFCGYDRYRFISKLENWRAFSWAFRAAGTLINLTSPGLLYSLLSPFGSRYTNLRNKIFKLRNAFAGKDAMQRYGMLMSIFTHRELETMVSALFKPAFPALEYKDERSLTEHDLNLYLPGDILVKSDRTSMNFGLEVREPLLDHILFEKVRQLPPYVNMGRHSGKRLLRHILGKHVPDKLWNRPKQGFGFPLDSWLLGSGREFSREIIRELSENSLMNRTGLLAMLDNYEKGLVNCHQIFTLLSLGIWLRNY